jgi:hypothetical protein
MGKCAGVAVSTSHSGLIPLTVACLSVDTGDAVEIKQSAVTDVASNLLRKWGMREL